ncbi:hypothetical protein [Amycolatopsis sp. PS_44_ISF1]|uniref:hypothetical protein n=1 Tax=Amycolatopsis sp. PS_44_ISF1 TaxID=2974917 RepID=UPI0028E07EE8|nr:hypothetical protein [Amycolatopsis sp. PS_44_ISF1]MDT8911615.1 hypothetical protein [Amycolatopsis sp. PS_44_ISF1]
MERRKAGPRPVPAWEWYAYLPLDRREATDTENVATTAGVEAVRNLLWDARNQLLRSPRSRGT